MNIYKVHLLNLDNTTKIIYVFSGDFYKYTHDIDDLNTLFQANMENEIFKNIFTQSELENIKNDSIDVLFVKWQLFSDDTINSIKLKISDVMNREYHPHEMYLFNLVNKKLNDVSIYDTLTQKKKLSLTKERFIQFLSNINEIDVTGIKDKEIYDFNDLISLNIFDKDITIKESLGQKFFITNNNYFYTVNPFDVLIYDNFLENYADNTITTLNNDLLLNNIPIKDHNIYLVLANDAISYSETNDLNVLSTLKIYYPFLFKNGITNNSELETEHIRLGEKINDLIDIDYFNNIQLMHNIYNGKISELPYLDKGIKHINFLIHPKYNFTLPLETIFKLIHATASTPFIKYNPSNRQEKIYKLYADKIAKNGKKIPFLSKGLIFKLIKKMAKQKKVSIYTQSYFQDMTIPIICEFDSNGVIEIICELQEPLLSNTLEKIIKDSVNPIISIVHEYLEQSGYDINTFESLYSNNIEYIQILYFSQITIQKNINLSNYMGCISNVFNVINGNLSKGIVMRFKRVSNYNEMDNINAFITEKFKIGIQNIDIVSDLMTNFNLSEEDAEKKISDLLSEFQLERGLHENKRLRIRNNPGFPTKIIQTPFQSNIIIEVDNIDNINYINEIELYIDSIIRITQDINSTKVKSNMIDTFCKKNFMQKQEITDIVAPAEDPIQQVVPILQDDELSFNSRISQDDEDVDDMLNILMGIDDDEESQEQEGGVSTIDSISQSEESSVSMPFNLAPGSESSDSNNTSASVELPFGLGSESASEEEITDTPTPPPETVPFGVESSEELKSATPEPPAPEPATPEPATLEPATLEPATLEPATLEPATPEPLESESSEELKSATLEPVAPEPFAPEPVALEPLESESSEELKSATLEPLESKSSEELKSATPEPATFEPVASETVESEPAAPEPATPEPTTPEPVESESAIPEPVASESVESESAIPEPVAPEPVAPEPFAPEPVALEPVALEPVAPEPVASETVAPEPVAPEQFSSETSKSIIGKPITELINNPSESNILTNPDSEGSIKQFDPLLESSVTPQLESTVKQKEKQKLQLEVAEESKETDEDFNYNIDGMSLSNPNPIFKRLHDKDPSLFLTEDNGKFKQYSRACPWNVRRQPVLLTVEEKEKIDRENPGSYDKALKYGSDKENEYWYICPRYWCLLNNTALSEEDVRQGKCGGKIIPTGAKKVPPGKYILEFNDPKEHRDQNGDYIVHNPGFLKSKTEDGKCIPCCFKNWASPEQERRREECKNNEIIKEKTAKEKEDYIKKSEKFPLEINRWGYIPLAVQKFLHTDNTKCYVSTTNHNIKPNTTCILRHGVELSVNQSFVACIADIYVDNVGKDFISIKDMRDIIVKSLDLDNFITYQNATLINEFSDTDESKINKTDIKPFESSILYKSIDKDDSDKINYLKRVINAYNNFILFLKSDESNIDHTYLWDIICKPNPKLFEKGMNLVILNLNNMDITDNIDIVCPTNQYSSHFYETGKSTIFLLKSELYYEPIYAYNNTEFELNVTKTFNEFSNKLMPNIRKVLQVINNLYKYSCTPLPSMPSVYKFKKNNNLDLLTKQILKLGLIVKTQIMNYQSKIIGIVALNPESKIEGFLPCYPSVLNPKFKFIYMDDDNIWKSYSDTISFLLDIKKQDEAILCKPIIKVIEDELVVGIITETNQLIAIDPPSEDIHDDGLIKQETDNYLIADIASQSKDGYDKERKNTIKYIKLENNFYNVFRNSIRILLNNSKHKDIRDKIENIINTDSMIYLDKINEVDTLLKRLGSEYIKFVEYDKSILDKIDSISGCINKDTDSCDKEQYCAVNKNSECSLLIPNKHLLSGIENKNIYYGRMADEIIRYNRVRYFIFEPKEFLNFNNVDYNLWPTEIILLQSLLNQEYFDNLIPVQKNPFIFSNSHENTVPQITQNYSDTQSLNNFKKEPDTSECIPKRKMQISGKWENSLPAKGFEYIFDATPNCSFELMVRIIKDFTGNQDIEIYILRKLLIDLYEKYMNKYKENILSILTAEGKKNMMHQIYYNQITFDMLIMSESYYLTNLDIWLFSEHFNIPIVLLSGTLLVENNDSILITMISQENKYYFIKSPGIKQDQAMKYRLISLENNINLSLQEMPNSMKVIINNIITKQTTVHKPIVNLEEFISDFKVKQRQRRPRKKLENFFLKKSDEPDEDVVPKKIKKKGRLQLKQVESPSLDTILRNIDEKEQAEKTTSVMQEEEQPIISVEPSQAPPPKSSRKKKTPLDLSAITAVVKEEKGDPLKISSVLESEIPIPIIPLEETTKKQEIKKTVKKKKNIFRKRDQPLDFMKVKPDTLPAPPKSI